MNQRSFFEQRPLPSECPEAHWGYVEQAPHVSLLTSLKEQSEIFRSLFGNLSDVEASFRYAPGKWSLKEMVGHLCDAERIFGYRALCIARGDEGPFPPFDEDKYVEGGRFDERSFADLTTQFGLIRKVTYSFYSSLNEAEWLRSGIASGHPYSVRAFGFVTVGHLAHHVKVVKERYLPAIQTKR